MSSALSKQKKFQKAFNLNAMKDASTAHQTSSQRSVNGTMPRSIFAATTGQAAPAVRPQLMERARILCVASGKGGTGKSFLASHLAMELAKKGNKVLLIDADFGLSDAHLYLGLKPKKDIRSLFNGNQANESVLMQGPHGLRYLYGGSGLANLTQLTRPQWEKLLKALSFYEQRHSHIILDLAAGIGPQVLPYLIYADESILVSNPEPLALLDVFATIKVLHKKHYAGMAHLVMNRSTESRGEKAATLLRRSIQRWKSPMPIHYLGAISESRALQDAVKRRHPLTELFPFDPGAIDLRKIAKSLIQLEAQYLRKRPVGQPYFQRVRAYWS